MGSIYLARHGETTWNAIGRYQGRLESELSDLGQLQAEALAAAFTTARRAGDEIPQRIVSSPLVRCRQTAEPTVRALGLTLETDPLLLEIAHGPWEGLLRAEISERHPEQYRAWRDAPDTVNFEGGESLADVVARWRIFADAIAERDEITLVVTHDAVVRAALLVLQNRPLAELWQMPVENAGFAVITRAGAKLELQTASRFEHLGKLRASLAAQAL